MTGGADSGRVDRGQVEAMARLAQLSVDEAEAERLAEEMSRILEYADRLRTVRGPADVVGRGEAVPPAAVDASTSPASEPDELLRSPADFAPRFEEGFFVVPPPPGVTPAGSHSHDAAPADSEAAPSPEVEGVTGEDD